MTDISLSTSVDMFSKGLITTTHKSIGSGSQEALQYPLQQVALFLASIPTKVIPQPGTLLTKNIKSTEQPALLGELREASLEKLQVWCGPKVLATR